MQGFIGLQMGTARLLGSATYSDSAKHAVPHLDLQRSNWVS